MTSLAIGSCWVTLFVVSWFKFHCFSKINLALNQAAKPWKPIFRSSLVPSVADCFRKCRGDKSATLFDGSNSRFFGFLKSFFHLFSGCFLRKILPKSWQVLKSLGKKEHVDFEMLEMNVPPETSTSRSDSHHFKGPLKMMLSYSSPPSPYDRINGTI